MSFILCVRIPSLPDDDGACTFYTLHQLVVFHRHATQTCECEHARLVCLNNIMAESKLTRQRMSRAHCLNERRTTVPGNLEPKPESENIVRRTVRGRTKQTDANTHAAQLKCKLNRYCEFMSSDNCLCNAPTRTARI